MFVVVYLGMRGIYFAALGAEGNSACRLWWEDLSGGVPMCWIRYLGLTSELPGLYLFLSTVNGGLTAVIYADTHLNCAVGC